MKNILIIATLLSFSLAGTATSTFSVEGMMCAKGCVGKVNKAINSVDGVKTIDVDFNKSVATVTFDDQKANEGQILAALKAGTSYSCNVKEKADCSKKRCEDKGTECCKKKESKNFFQRLFGI